MSDLAFSNSVFGYLILISTDFYDFVLLLSLVSVSIAKKHRSLKSVFDQILFLSVFGNVVKLSLLWLIFYILKELSHSSLSYFSRVQNEIEK